MPPGLTTRSTLAAAVAPWPVASTPNATAPFRTTFQPCSTIAILLVRADRLLALDRLGHQPAGRARNLLVGDRLLGQLGEFGLNRRLDLVEADARPRRRIDREG